jgi:hypothetical protein
VQPDHRESRQLEAQRALVDQRRVPLDYARILERPHATKTRRRGKSNSLRERHIGERSVRHKLANNAPVSRVEAKGHESLSIR